MSSVLNSPRPSIALAPTSARYCPSTASAIVWTLVAPLRTTTGCMLTTAMRAAVAEVIANDVELGI